MSFDKLRTNGETGSPRYKSVRAEPIEARHPQDLRQAPPSSTPTSKQACKSPYPLPSRERVFYL